MKILAVNASPTGKRGMTDVVMKHIIAGAESAGADIETVYLKENKINYCNGCFACWVKHPGTCIHKDDMPGILDKIIGADVVLLATPLYVDGMTAQAKTFMDRLVTLVDPHIEKVNDHWRHARRHDKTPDFALASVCGFYELDNFDGLVDHMNRACRNFRSDFLGAVLRPVSYIFKLEEMLPEAVKDIRAAIEDAGRELVTQKAFKDETLARVAQNPLSKDDHLEGANAFFDQCISEGKFLYA